MQKDDAQMVTICCEAYKKQLSKLINTPFIEILYSINGKDVNFTIYHPARGIMHSFAIELERIFLWFREQDYLFKQVNACKKKRNGR